MVGTERSEGKREHIVVVGAGPVGSMLAIFLAQRNNDVTVIEKRSDLRATGSETGRSINLALANRGMSALEKLGLKADVEELLIPMRGRMIHDPSGDCHLQPYGQAAHEVIYSVGRNELNALLLDVAEDRYGVEDVDKMVDEPEGGRVRFYFQHQCVGIDLQAQRVTIQRDGSESKQTLSYDRLVGADGAGSVVRKAIMQQESEFEEYEPLGHSYKELLLPADDVGDFKIDKNALHIWPRGGFMMIALPNLGGSFTVTLFLPNQGESGFEQLSDESACRQFFETHFPDVLTLMPDWYEQFQKNPVGSLGTLRCSPWRYEDSAFLIGDAAHAIVPFHGQGMNCGFEDCEVLNQCLQRSNSWKEALDQYVKSRMPSTNAIADMAIENYEEMRSRVNDPIFKLKSRVGFELQNRYPDRFVPRYGMVMFQTVPYELAQLFGRKNDALLNRLITGIDSLEDVDWSLAEALLNGPEFDGLGEGLALARAS